MSFYDKLSEYYDIIFKENKNTLNFLMDDVDDKIKVLDIACGTGTYSIPFAEKGHEIIGIDLNEEMIKKANEKKENLKVSFEIKNMENLIKDFKENEFDRVFCIGNSIVHLESKNKIEKALKDIKDLLKNNGELIIQIINYNRILKKGITELPTIKREEERVEFIRNYRYNKEKNKVDFNTTIIIYDKNLNIKNEYKNSIELLPLLKNDLEDMIKRIGFTKYEFFGDFNKSKYIEDESYALIVRAYK
ncbi:class I SAM-dependent methyltransferase [Clostridium fallax]|uniref:Methyltransferase domain-containing protein n=1 Tax=Clostridium fallax TaxID=1533 RepID=A0A1M4U2X8_9CLOT|nr:class I SAM-dependent methyltransferase [Clostridium fallax]SHE50994.1 Methyltransferase domain-containing protein [Clostridium fallax]SQB06048.1 methyltransferase family protein [Clostridium fallax]